MSQEDAVNPRKTPKITVVHDLLDLTAIFVSYEEYSSAVNGDQMYDCWRCKGGANL